ncbi:MAG TPA: hypothetical protein VFZ34_20585 [Blastocatellia bacterium]|nr:hypothetical protein [Blastocatellia bacterium]
MFLKQDFPTTHRMTLVMAITLSSQALFDSASWAVFSRGELGLVMVLMSIAFFQWMKRRSWARQGLTLTQKQARFNWMDKSCVPMQQEFDAASVGVKMLYWLPIFLAAVVMYLLLGQ